MAELSFFDSMKDKMSCVGGNAFSEYVEEATSDLLLTQDPDKVQQLVHFGNQGGEHIDTLLNAVRRRIDNKNAKVRCYTIVVLDALIRRCGRDLHRELATQKGLLRQLVLQAAGKDASTESEMRARELASQLVLSCSYWFAEHPDEAVQHQLSQLANHARVAGATFEGIEADRDFRPRLDLPEPRGNASINAEGTAVPQSASGRRTAGQRPHRPSRQQQEQRAREQALAIARARERQHVIVDAIPVKCPDEEKLAGMMEGVVLMGECLSQAEQDNTAKDVAHNEMINAVSAEVRRDHELVSELLGTGIELENRDTLQSICDSQISVLQRHTEMLIAAGAPQMTGGAPAESGEYASDEARAIAESLAEYQRQQQQSQGRSTDAAEPSTSTSHPPDRVAVSRANERSAGEPHMGTYRERISRFYEFYQPAKLGDVDRVLEKFAGREDEMIRQLKVKYGNEPMPPQDSQPHGAASPSVASTSVGSPQQSAGQAQPPAASSYRERLVRFYEFYNPEKLADVDKVLEKFAGREEAMIRQLKAKYGDEPAAPQPQQPEPKPVVAEEQKPPAKANAPPSIDDLFQSVTQPAAPPAAQAAPARHVDPQPAFDPFADQQPQPAWTASEAPVKPPAPEMPPAAAPAPHTADLVVRVETPQADDYSGQQTVRPVEPAEAQEPAEAPEPTVAVPPEPPVAPQEHATDASVDTPAATKEEDVHGQEEEDVTPAAAMTTTADDIQVEEDEPAAADEPVAAQADDLAIEDSQVVVQDDAAAPPAAQPAPFPAMTQNVDPSLPAGSDMVHSDEAAAREASKAKPPAKSSAKPARASADDDDFDAFLNSRLK